jgi:hypothetical protein
VTDIALMDADCIHGLTWWDCPTCADDAARQMRRFIRSRFDSTPYEWWPVVLGMYRQLRIRVPYGPPGGDLDGHRANGCSYGMTRTAARVFLLKFMLELDWHGYLGSK